MSRDVSCRYVDPLEAVWLAVARAFGLEVSRSPEVYASTDGRGGLVLGTAPTLDADDCVAQMVFHELCHACVQGPENLTAPDWGLDNETARDVVREHACLRLQAALATPHGLRWVFAPTTDYRAFYDALPDDPLEGEGEDVPLARAALARSERPPFAPHVGRGLALSAVIVRAVLEAEAHAPAAEASALHARYVPPPQGVAASTPASGATGRAETP